MILKIHLIRHIKEGTLLTLFHRFSHMVRRLKVPPHVALVAVLELAVEAEEHADPVSNSIEKKMLKLSRDSILIL